MWTKFPLIVLMAGLSGCAGTVATIFDPLIADEFEVSRRHDISTTDDTAIIAGSKKGVVNRETCNIIQPAATMELIVDAGKTSLVVGCVHDNVMDHMGRYWYAGIEFDAEAGHAYEIGPSSLIDISDNKRLGTRRLIFFPGMETAIESISKAIVVSSGHADIKCSIEKATRVSGGQSDFEEYYGVYFILEPGQYVASTRCIEWGGSYRPSKEKIKHAFKSEIVIDAEAGHFYSFGMQSHDAKCIQLADITTDRIRPLVCQPVEQLDELLGLTRVGLCVGPKTSCSEMTSCAEAMAYLKCHLQGLDHNNNGIPCESICLR